MSTDHRKPFLAFVVLALLATALVGVQRADAQPGRFLAAVIGTTVRVQGMLPTSEVSVDAARHRLVSLGPAFMGLPGNTPGFVEPLVDSLAGRGAGLQDTAAGPAGKGHASTARDGAPGNGWHAAEHSKSRADGAADARATTSRLRRAVDRSSSEARTRAGASVEALEKAASRAGHHYSAATKAARKGAGRAHAGHGRRLR